MCGCVSGEKAMALVTVVIPLYNKEEQIGRAIRSVREQTFADWRMVVVDDGSTDAGPAIVEQIEDERIEMVRQANAGPGAARNAGAKLAESKYVAFLDADDEWYPQFLERTLEAIEEHDVAMVSATMVELPRGNDTLAILRENGVEPGVFSFKGDEDAAQVRAIISVIRADNNLMRTDIVRQYGGFFEQGKCVYAEDTTFLWRVMLSERFIIVGPALAVYHMEDSDLGSLTEARPLAPYLRDPNTILQYCPPEKHELVRRLLDILVLRRVRSQARYGQRLQSFLLMLKHPGAKRYEEEYRECLKRVVPGFETWCRIKSRLRSLRPKRQ